jgi:hypothetical protein
MQSGLRLDLDMGITRKCGFRQQKEKAASDNRRQKEKAASDNRRKGGFRQQKTEGKGGFRQQKERRLSTTEREGASDSRRKRLKKKEPKTLAQPNTSDA